MRVCADDATVRKDGHRIDPASGFRQPHRIAAVARDQQGAVDPTADKVVPSGGERHRVHCGWMSDRAQQRAAREPVDLHRVAASDRRAIARRRYRRERGLEIPVDRGDARQLGKQLVMSGVPDEAGVT